MSWNGRDHDETVAQEFRRALHRSAEDQIVADAERAVREIWLGELAELQDQLSAEYARAHAIHAAAWTAVHERRQAQDEPGLAVAQRALGRSNTELCRCAEAERMLTDIATEERELMSRADEECDLIATANRIRVRSAWDDLRAVWAEREPARVPGRPGGARDGG